MGGKTQTQTTSSNQSYTPTGLSQLNDIWNKVQNVSSTPYQPYTGQLTAGLDPTQQAGINTINNAQGTAQPYFNKAADYANQGAANIAVFRIIFHDVINRHEVLTERVVVITAAL